MTIKALVFDFVHRHNGDVDYEELTDEVLRYFPTSKWKPSHWRYWRYQILSGKVAEPFSDTERGNLEAGKGTKPVPPNATGKVPTKAVPAPLVEYFINRIEEEQHNIASVLARLTHHVHPDIVAMIQMHNADPEEQARLHAILPAGIAWDAWMHPGSACVFPGVRRFVGRVKKKEILKYVQKKRCIIDDNRFPRNLWTFIAIGEKYTGPNWKSSGLSAFELAHIFGHKPSQRGLEEEVFTHFNAANEPYSLFSCAANVVLIPKGCAKPTDGLPAVRVAFFKRYIELYGEECLPGLRGLDEDAVPEWYPDLEWNEPVLPENWKANVKALLRYRHERLAKLFAAGADQSNGG